MLYYYIMDTYKLRLDITYLDERNRVDMENVFGAEKMIQRLIQSIKEYKVNIAVLEDFIRHTNINLETNLKEQEDKQLIYDALYEDKVNEVNDKYDV